MSVLCNEFQNPEDCPPGPTSLHGLRSHLLGLHQDFPNSAVLLPIVIVDDGVTAHREVDGNLGNVVDFFEDSRNAMGSLAVMFGS